MATKEYFPATTYRLGTTDDKISPFKVAVLVFVREYCTTRLRQLGLVFDLDSGVHLTPEQCKDFCLLSLELIQCYDITWEEFELVLEPGNYNLHQQVIQDFVGSLHQIAKNGATGLLNLGQNLENLLMEPKKGKPMIRRDSVLGIFIRKQVLQLDKMSFEETVELSDNLITYLDKTRTFEDPMELVKVSRKQAELLVSQQLAMIQRNEALALRPVNLRKIIDRVLHENKDFAEANYLAHLNELRSKDFGQAENKLHKAYDQGTVSIDGLIHSRLEENLINNKSFRYAALNLANLYANFGHKKLALLALNECVAQSGEAADQLCLQEALAWYCKLEENPLQREKMIERLISKSSELNLHYLTSLGLQMWTQECAMSGVPPSKVFDYLHASEVANCQHALTDMALTNLALRAAIWNFFGFPGNALQVSQLLLTLHTGDPTKGNVYFNNECVHIAVCNIALHLARMGRYQESDYLIKFAASQYSHFQQHSHLWKVTELHVTFYRTLWLAQWDKAEQIVNQLAVFDRLESLYKRAHLLLCKGDACNSKIVLDDLERKLSHPDESDSSARMINPGWDMARNISLRVKSLMVHSSLLCSQHHNAEALEHVSRALDMCSTYHMSLQLALASLQLAEIQLHMDLATNALDLIDKHMNTIYTHGSLLEQGLASFLKARCLMAQARRSANSEKVKKTDVMSLLVRAKKIFTKIEAFYHLKDVVFFEALLYHHLGYEKERNTRAMNFRQLDDHYPTKSSFANVMVFVSL